MAYFTDGLMTYETLVFSALIMVKAQLRFLILKTTLHMPTREGHQQQSLQSCSGRRVTDKVFDFLGLKDVAGHDQVAWRCRIMVIPLRIKSHMLNLPDHRTLFTV